MNENIVTSPIRLITNSPLDIKSSSVENVNDLYSIPMNERYIGLTKLVKSEQKEYWLLENTSNMGWVIKNVSSSEIFISGGDVEIIENNNED